MPHEDRDFYRHYVAFMSVLVLIALGGMAVAIYIASYAKQRTVHQEHTIEILDQQQADLRKANEELTRRVEAMEKQLDADDASENIYDAEQDEKIESLDSDVEMILDGIKDSCWKDQHRC